MRIKPVSKLLSIGLIFLITLQSIGSVIILPINKYNEIVYPGTSALDPTEPAVGGINIRSEGDKYRYDWLIRISAYDGSHNIQYLTKATYTYQFEAWGNSFTGFKNVYLNTGIPTGSGIFSVNSYLPFDVPSGQFIVPTTTDVIATVCVGFTSPYILFPTGANNLYQDSAVNMQIYWSYGTTYGSLFAGTCDTALYPVYICYDVQTNLILNSTHYNKDNVRAYTKTEISPAWIERDINNIRLNSAKYYLKLVDKESDLILYEDSALTNYTLYRTITIDSLKLQNNAAEPINATLKSTGHYQGAISFNDNIPNLKPAGFVVETTLTGGYYIVNKTVAGHDKVLELRDIYSTGWVYLSQSIATMTAGSFEFWWRTENLPASDFSSLFFLTSDVSDTSHSIELLFENSKIRVYDGSGYYDVCAASSNTWYHILLEFNLAVSNTFVISVNSVNYGTFNCRGTPDAIRDFRVTTDVTQYAYSVFFDAFDYSAAPGYFVGRNKLLNNSWDELVNWNCFPEWTNGYYESTDCWSPIIAKSDGDDFTDTGNWDVTINDAGTIKNQDMLGRNDVLEITGAAATQELASYTTTNQATGTIQIWFGTNNVATSFSAFYIYESATVAIALVIGWNSGKLSYVNSAGSVVDIMTVSSNILYHLTVVFDTVADTFNLYVDNILKLSSTAFRNVITNVNLVKCFTSGTAIGYYSAMSLSWEADYFLNLNTLNNATSSILAMEQPFSCLINPYTYKLTNYTTDNYMIKIDDLYGNRLQNTSIFSTENVVTYTPPNNYENFISLANQRGEYLNWENYRIYVNSTQIYSNTFYYELGSTANVSIYTRFNKYITSSTHTVTRTSNYIPITLTQLSLKIYNQQPQNFIYLNITFNSTYTVSTQQWSEWLAPGEIAEYMLTEDYYIVNVTEYESSSEQLYYYHLTRDDILLISSSNTIYNVLQNINLINTTLGNQFNYIALNFTATDSKIGNITTIISINFSGVNSTLENFLIYQMNNITAINTNLTTLLLSSTNNFNWINSNLTTLFAMNSNSFAFINGTVQDSYILLDNSFQFTNATIGSIASLAQNSFNYLNSSIQNSITYMAMNFTQLNSDIGVNQLAILTQFAITQSNVTNNTLNIVNNVLAINSSISNLIANLENNVLLVNNSIYTAVLDVSTSLALDSNNILGNLSITYQQNEFLTELFKKAMFSELLNWTGAGYNYSLIEDQLKTVQCVNEFNNQSIEIVFKYSNLTQSLILAAQQQLPQIMPITDVTYRILSVASGEVLRPWQNVTNEVKIGDYNATVVMDVEQNPVLNVIVFTAIMIITLVLAVYTSKKIQNMSQERRKTRKIDHTIQSMKRESNRPEFSEDMVRYPSI